MEKNINLDILKKFDVVSFDFFDTLFLRAVSEPEDVFDLVELISGEHNFKEKRRLAQTKAFQEMLQKGKKEITYQDIYNNYEGEENKALVQRLEEEIEKSVIKPNSELIPVYHELIQNGVQVVITSDMYYQREFFLSVLEKNGIHSHNVDLFISADDNATKRDSGELFDIVKEKYLGKSIAHIGDNFRSDVEMARSKDIEAFYYAHSDPVTQTSETDTPVLSICRALHRTHAPHLEKGSPVRGAYQIAGPAVYGFYEWVKQSTKKDNLDLVLYLSRDGYLLDRLAAVDPSKSSIPSAYFKGSRTAFTLACINEENYEEYITYLTSGSSGLSPKELLERIGVTPPANEVLADLGLDDNFINDNSSVSNERLYKMLSAFKSDIVKVCKQNRRALFNYMHQLGLRNGMKVGLVDIGWRGTTQNIFEKFVDEYYDLNVNGYYLGLTEKAVNKKSMLEDLSFPQSVVNDVYENRVFIELLFSAPHPSVTGYDLYRGDIEFLFDEGRGTSDNTSELMREFEKGVLEFYSHFNQLLQELRVAPDVAALLQPLLDCIGDGTWKEFDYVRDINNFDAWSSSANLKTTPMDY